MNLELAQPNELIHQEFREIHLNNSQPRARSLHVPLLSPTPFSVGDLIVCSNVVRFEADRSSGAGAEFEEYLEVGLLFELPQNP